MCMWCVHVFACVHVVNDIALHRNMCVCVCVSVCVCLSYWCSSWSLLMLKWSAFLFPFLTVPIDMRYGVPPPPSLPFFPIAFKESHYHYNYEPVGMFILTLSPFLPPLSLFINVTYYPRYGVCMLYVLLVLLLLSSSVLIPSL